MIKKLQFIHCVNSHVSKTAKPPARRLHVKMIFQDGDRPPSWICFRHIWTSQGKHSMLFVFVTVQHLIMIDAVVLII